MLTGTSMYTTAQATSGDIDTTRVLLTNSVEVVSTMYADTSKIVRRGINGTTRHAKSLSIS